jgi:hypothetical protein
MKPRLYNKLYVNTNRADGSEKVMMGYRHNQKEIIFKKDRETYFHVPIYASPVALAESRLIENGATAGTFPAAADRIFKSQKNYGDVSPHGSPQYNNFPSNGLWFCSWLKYNPTTKQVQWVDRFYDPGRFIYEQAEKDLTAYRKYEKHDPAFIDVPTTFVFEQDVLYKYYHVGEKTSQELLASFEGVNREFLGLHLNDWGKEEVDLSTNKIKVRVTSNAPLNELYSEGYTNTSVVAPTINFNHKYDVSAQAEWSAVYSLENEFTWSFWAHSENWQASNSTQLFGNYSVAGEGIGVFLDSLESYPFLVVPETTYGRLLFINQDIEGYLDKAIVGNQSVAATPSCMGITSEREVIVCNQGQAGGIYKFDHVGNVLFTTKNLNDRSKFFVFPNQNETPKQMLCGPDDTVHILTNEGYYKFDRNLAFQKSMPFNTTNTVMAFSYTLSGEASLRFISNANDAKCINTDEWVISNDGNLYKNDALIQIFEDHATTLAVSPDEKLWIAHGSNKITILNPTDNSTVTFTVGSSTRKEEFKKTISFIKKYTRTTGTSVWSGIVLYSDERILYTCDLTGIVKTRTKLIDLIDFKQLQQKNQTEESSTFLAVGDFTGYERDRTINPCFPVANKPQLKLKVSHRDASKDVPVFENSVLSVPITNWTLNSWQHFGLIFKNKTLELYINAQKQGQIQLKGNQRLTNLYQNTFFIGTETGHKFGLNKELGYTSRIFNGKVSDIRIFNYAFKAYDLKTFIDANAVGEDLFWQVSMPMTQYVEQVNRFFKNKLPGAKSQLFKIKLHGTNIRDTVAQQLIEAELIQLIAQQKPSYTDLLKFEWIS